MKTVNCFLFYILFSILGLSAQQTSFPLDSTIKFTLQKSITISAKDIETDRLGNIFIVNNTNQLYKYSKDGKSLGTLNYNYQGNISYVDPGNPLEVYVFYKELNKIIYLDNNLAFRGEVDLNNLNIGQASAIARSFDNGIWVFDLTDLQLKKMSKDGQNIQMSGNIRQYTNSEKFTPSEIVENGNRVLVNDSLLGILVFDVFCNYVKRIPILGCDHIKIIDDDLYFLKDNLIGRYSLKNFNQAYFSLPQAIGLLDVSIEKERIYLLKKDEVLIYAY